MTDRRDNHIVVLDGLRGIAAITVAAGHLNGVFSLWPNYSHSQLAVDFFFMLSGFVIARAYEPKLQAGLTFRSFLQIRLIRLYPLIFLGVIVGVISRLVDGAAGNSPVAVLGAAAFAFLMLPLPRSHSSTDVSAFPLNGPLWSLSYELFSNVLYGALAPRLSTRILIASTCAMVAALAAYIAIEHGVSANVGWNLGLLWGIPRVLASFSIGILLYRFRHVIERKRLGTWAGLAASVLFTAVLWVPIGQSAIFDFTMIAVCFPAILVLGLQSEQKSVLTPIWAWLGAISYPIYVLNQPIYRIGKVITQSMNLKEFVLPFIIMFAFSILISQLAISFYDAPLRAWLRDRLRKPEVPSDTTANPSIISAL